MDAEPGAREVRSLLGRSEAYRELPEGTRAQLLADMTKVVEVLADRSWLAAPPSPVAGAPGKEREARAMDERMAALRERTAKAVDFPGFVSELVQGVFEAIVDVSIQQMKSYAEFLASVSKSIDEFVDDNSDDEGARDRLAVHRGAEAPRRDLAKGRQQQLATMVLMGINRIVVTDGR